MLNVIPQINSSVWDHDLDAPLDLSRPTASTTEVIALSSPLSSTTASHF
ncbi:unnamed protein product [Didymodactylos carnosus]|uniref:Uncharacterized protein n=1 Tax=Didymodactylos carnosus TaxID=1234261 RepID=A0A8S2SY53_9BILA|nr:unnamed protein product [Didymodactylos carnosus]CAF4250594.1 unnamed protein product [Didymodactylos carnosus]